MESHGMTQAQAQAQHRAIMTLAMMKAQGAVKNELKRQGRRLADVEYKEVMAMARDYLDQHPAELIAKAKETVDLWHAQGRFGPRGGFR
jgi:hypothetical protein